jgi:hypothetical protein
MMSVLMLGASALNGHATTFSFEYTSTASAPFSISATCQTSGPFSIQACDASVDKLRIASVDVADSVLNPTSPLSLVLAFEAGMDTYLLSGTSGGAARALNFTTGASSAGALSISLVPLPDSVSMLGAALTALGVAGYVAKRKATVAVQA